MDGVLWNEGPSCFVQCWYWRIVSSRSCADISIDVSWGGTFQSSSTPERFVLLDK